MVFVAVMFSFGFLLVPLYDVFCELTGLNGKIKSEAVTEVRLEADMSRTVSVEFLTTVNGKMPLKFSSEVKKLKVHPGEYHTVKFFGTNASGDRIVGRAIPSIAPGWGARFLQKVQCFCFDEQVFEPHERREMDVRFVIDPELPDTVADMTLSYTFFDITAEK